MALAKVERLRTAIEEKRVHPCFQPIVSVATGQLRGFEVLARWTDPQLGAIRPDTFIPLARSGGMLAALTLSLMRQACTAARDCAGEFYLAFNIPPGLLIEPAFVQDWLDVAAECAFPLHRLRVEMTEVEVVEDEEAAELSIALLRRVGIKTMLDDFGTGYSSLVRLHRFQFNKIKIDGSFIQTLEEDEASRKIVSAIVGLGKSLGADVVAECVQTRFQLDFLASIGCDAYQGWLLAAAMEASQLETWLTAYQPQQRVGGGSMLSPYQRQYQLEILYDRSPVGLCFIDPDLRFIDANLRFCQMIGLQRSAILGRQVGDVLDEPLRQRVLAVLLKSLYDGQGDLREFTFAGREETWLISHDRVLDAAGVLLGVSVVCIDVTERKRYEAALQLREQGDLGMALDSPTVMWVAEASGVLSYISPHAMDDEGSSLQQRIDRWYARMHPRDRVRVRAEWNARAIDATQFQTRFRVLWAGQEWRWVVSRATLHVGAGQPRWYGLFTDISREVALEQDLGRQRGLAALP